MTISRWGKRFAAGGFALVASLLAAGCGFHPLYGSAPVGSALGRTLSDIYVEPIADTGVAGTGYELRLALVQGLNSDKGGRYVLKTTLNETTQGIALLTNASITRYNDTLTVRYTLTDTISGKMLKQGTETGLAAYNVVSSPYATLIAQQDADKREAQDIAERMRIEIGVFFEQQQSKTRP
jgi:LPS-assembly lipoprotein